MAGSYVEILTSLSRVATVVNLKRKGGAQLNANPEERIFPDKGGGFYYGENTKFTANRNITWRYFDNLIELEEISEDYNLYGNKLQFTVTDEILLPNVVVIEKNENVYIFVATTRSIHQLTFQHPNHQKYGFICPRGMDVSLPSIFHNSQQKLQHNQASLPQLCEQFDVALTDDSVYFGLVSQANTLIAAELIDDECNCIELKETSLAHRLWTGIVPSFVRGESANWMGVESVVLHTFGESEIYAFTICKDLKIRVWSLKSQSCILTKDLVEFIPDRLDSQPNMVGALSIKKAKSNIPTAVVLAAHCCLLYSSQFIIMEVFKDPSSIVMMHVSNFFSDYTNIQDFSISNRYLWALWQGTEADEEHKVCYAPIEGGKLFERGWHNVHLKSQEKEEIYIGMFQDTKEAYIQKIFSPTFYIKEAVFKALQVYVKTNDFGHEFLPPDDCDLNMLKESVISILDVEVERNTIGRELDVAEYQEICVHCWSRYYSLVLQCTQAKESPLGLHINEKNGKGYVIRKECTGIISYLNWPDHLYRSILEECEGVKQYVEDELNLPNDPICQDIVLIFECLKSIPLQFSNDVIIGIDNDLDGNEDVKSFLSAMASSLITNTSDFEQLVGDTVERGDYLCYLEGRLKNVKDPKKAVDYILNAIDIVDITQHTPGESPGSPVVVSQDAKQFLCSKLGVQIITNLLLTTAECRMHLCRDLFIMLKFMATMSCKIDLELSTARDFDSLTSGTCYELFRSYHTVVWSAKTILHKLDASVVDNNITSLASLRLTERSPSSKTARKIDAEENEEIEVLSILSCFVRDVGIQSALSRYKTSQVVTSDDINSYQEMLSYVKEYCLNQIWVLNQNDSDFPEYLTAHGQYAILNEYLHFCDEWCMVNRGSKDFLLAQSYLGTDQPNKALKYFISAARGISLKESLLINLLDNGEVESKQEALVLYFIKVMRLFEQYNFPSFVISAASSALTIAKKTDSHIPMLWSVIFKYHLELKHHNEAYAAIVHNPDKTRRQDCLRHFIITLCDRGLFQEICTYPYVNLQEEVVSIIEARARTMDITVNRFYDLLYSYYIFKSDYRKAATTMYEQACRLQCEMHGLKSLQKQAKCLLASITALQLVDEKYAWIVRPQEKIGTPSSQPNKTGSKEYSQSPKRREDGEEIYYSTMKKPKGIQTVIVELSDLEKAYLLVLARLKLVQYGKNETIAVGPGLSAAETVGLLAQRGLFDMAFSVALKFNLSSKSIFETLAGKCANLVKFKPSEFDDRWNWLLLNEINSIQLVTSKSATQQAFHLLQTYLSKFSKPNSSFYLKIVATKFLSFGCDLPTWLIKDYKTTNPAELLHLYICFDMVSEATDLSIKYIDAVLGSGKEQFGLNTALHATTPPVWLPYTAFDQILKPLRDNQHNPQMSQLCERLEQKLEEYYNHLEIISCDKIDYIARTQARMT